MPKARELAEGFGVASRGWREAKPRSSGNGPHRKRTSVVRGGGERLRWGSTLLLSGGSTRGTHPQIAGVKSAARVGAGPWLRCALETAWKSSGRRPCLLALAARVARTARTLSRAHPAHTPGVEGGGVEEESQSKYLKIERQAEER